METIASLREGEKDGRVLRLEKACIACREQVEGRKLRKAMGWWRERSSPRGQEGVEEEEGPEGGERGDGGEEGRGGWDGREGSEGGEGLGGGARGMEGKSRARAGREGRAGSWVAHPPLNQSPAVRILYRMVRSVVNKMSYPLIFSNIATKNCENP